jgi:hypothetical protein
MSDVVQVVSNFYLFKTDVEQRTTVNAGRSSTASQRDSMKKLESRYDR